MIEDTICAIASPPAGGLRGIIRISGTDSLKILDRCLAKGHCLEPETGKRQRWSARRIESRILLPQPLGELPAAALLWPTRRSYTGQPSVELHITGAMPILTAAIEALVVAGARPARPGEFTLRAFLAGRLDLTQAEAVLGVIDAEESESLQIALDQLAGGLGKPLQEMRARLLDLLSHVEAGLDFVDEDIEFIRDDDLLDALRQIASPLEAISEQLHRRDRSGEIPLVILRGQPNAGKSRLLNALCKRETAIVADQAGTTRDPIQSIAKCGEHVVRFTDTAGIEAGTTEIDREAQTLAGEIDRRADVRLFCVDLAEDAEAIHRQVHGFRQALQTDHSTSIPTLFVGTKNDLLSAPPVLPSEQWIITSSLTGEGLQTLIESIVRCLEQQDREETKGVSGTAARCRASLQQASEAIEEAIQLIEGGGSHDLAAAEMRLALSALGEVTGEVYTDDILDRIFSRFCIGK